jgi:uncharacterized protein (TIGR02145 family)
MAISLLFIADKNDADILKSINDFKSDLAEDGSWDNEQMKVNMADWAESFDGGSVRANVNTWGILDVPKYEDFLTIFWNNAYGLGECDQTRYGVVLPVSNKLSKNYGNHYICKEYGWRKATVLEYDTYGKTCMTDGSIVDGAIISVNKYVCDAGKFRELSEMEKSLGKACVSYTENDEIRKRISVLSDSVYTCQNGLWIAEYVEEEDLLLDKRDSKVYRTVSIGNQIWMAENLDYSDSSVYIGMKKRSWCYKNSADSCAKYGRYYAWAAAMDSAGIFTSEGNGCGYGKGCFSTNVIRGICPEGWHLPSRTEWQTLYSAMNLSPNAMQAKGFEIWPNATDAYAFSAYPAGYTNVGNVRRFGEYAGFWTAYDYDNSEAFYWVVGTNEAYISTDHKYNGYSVRCVKD